MPNMNVSMPPPPAPVAADKSDPKGVLNSVPAWGSYLYQNFLLPAFSPNIASEWLNLNSPFASNTTAGNNNNNSAQNSNNNNMQSPDYFSQSWSAPAPTKVETQESIAPQTQPAVMQSQQHQFAFQPSLQAQFAMYQQSVAGPSYSQQPVQQQYYPPTWFNSSHSGIDTSLLVNNNPGPQQSGLPTRNGSGGSTISPSVDVVDAQVSASPSPLHSVNPTPHMSPKLGAKRRASSMEESEADHEHYSHDEHEPEVPEGVERDGMIWGMKVENYRALSARERKRVRNRISARTFRAKRKEHLSTLEYTISNKDLQIKLANEEALRLKKEVTELKRRLAKYENVDRL